LSIWVTKNAFRKASRATAEKSKPPEITTSVWPTARIASVAVTFESSCREKSVNAFSRTLP
jgi:hypothetical protein